MVVIKSGDVLASGADLIAHQCNCRSVGAKGLARKIFRKFPKANDYKDRVVCFPQFSTPGLISVRGRIVNMFAQVWPGKASGRVTRVYGKEYADTQDARHDYFAQALASLAEIINKKAKKDEHKTIVAFPYGIGCGLAGGNWEAYRGLIDDFAEIVRDTARVEIYRLTPDT